MSIFQKIKKELKFILEIFKAYLPYFLNKNSADYYFNKELSEFDNKRVEYYCKLDSKFPANNKFISIFNFKWTKFNKQRRYFFDLLPYLNYFSSNLKFSYKFGDIIDIPEEPSFTKSRPITGLNQNSILINLDKSRHFYFVSDNIPFEEKKNILFWRGNIYQEHRKNFMSKFFNNPLCDIGQTNHDKCENKNWIKNFASIDEHLKYKFILTIEGNDVATNLKWVMSSNSLAFMVKPKYETWFMEGCLIPNYHYVLLNDDYSDLVEKIEYYSINIEEAKSITLNANKYVEQFKNVDIEKTITIKVIDKYFRYTNSNQI